MKKIIVIAVAVLATACHQTKVDKEEKNYSIKGDTIVLPEHSIIQPKLKIEPVQSAPYRSKLITTGVVKAIPNKYAQVASPFAGRITKSFVRLGQHVSLNAPIFEISSPAYFEAGKAYYQAKQQMQLAEKQLKRQQDLLKNGVGIQKDVEEATVSYEVSKRDYENCAASLQVFHVDPENMVLGQPLIVRSPIEGEIIDDKIVIGQYIKEDAEPIAIVAELSKVWVVGQVKEKDIHAVHESDEVGISISGMPDLAIKGKVYHISEVLDEETRSLQVFIECDNHAHNLKPGMYVNTQFTETTSDAIIIPNSSVLQMEGSSFVFVQSGKNRYIRKAVESLNTDNNKVILKSGLNPKDLIVTEGGFYLLDAI
jgi:cobalt-zinc-cadmium efflux system membrane fusion protein